jgi:hypothetical protein
MKKKKERKERKGKKEGLTTTLKEIPEFENLLLLLSDTDTLFLLPSFFPSFFSPITLYERPCTCYLLQL